MLRPAEVLVTSRLLAAVRAYATYEGRGDDPTAEEAGLPDEALLFVDLLGQVKFPNSRIPFVRKRMQRCLNLLRRYDLRHTTLDNELHRLDHRLSRRFRQGR